MTVIIRILITIYSNIILRFNDDRCRFGLSPCFSTIRYVRATAGIMD